MRATIGCCASDAAITRVVLDDGGLAVGIVGLHDVFETFVALGRSPEEPGLAQELTAQVRVRNYVSPSVEAQYEAALLREYASFWAARVGREGVAHVTAHRE